MQNLVKTLMETLMEIKASIARVETTTKNLEEKFETHRDDFKEHLKKDDDRFGKVMWFLASASGGLAVLVFLLSHKS